MVEIAKVAKQKESKNKEMRFGEIAVKTNVSRGVR